MTRIFLLIAAMTAIVTSGCYGESSRPNATGEGVVRAISAIPTAPGISFQIEERQIGVVEYKQSTPTQQFDDLDYTFNFATLLAGSNDATRVASRHLDVVKDKDYTFVITGNLNAPDILLWEADLRDFGATDTIFQLRFGLVAEAIGDVDVYFAAPGVPPALGQQVGTLTFGEILPATDFAQGEHVLTLTAAGEPGTVLFTSETLNPLPATAYIMSIFEGDPNDLTPVVVRLIEASGSSSSIPAAGALPTLRFINASAETPAADIYIEEELGVLTTAVAENQPFRGITGDIDAVESVNYITYTPPADTSVLLFEDSLTLPAVTHFNYFLYGPAGSLGRIVGTSDRRPVETFAKFSVAHASSNHPSINFFIVEADGNLEEAVPVFIRVATGSSPSRTNLRAGSYDIYVEAADEARTLLAGPYRFEPLVGDIHEFVLLDNVAQPEIIDIMPIPLP